MEKYYVAEEIGHAAVKIRKIGGIFEATTGEGKKIQGKFSPISNFQSPK